MTDPDAAERPFVDAEVHDGLRKMLSRALEFATPESLVQGGATEDRVSFDRRPRNHEELEHREAVYKAGGPVTAIIDKRALMIYGTGVEFETEDVAITNERGRTVDEWLDAQMGDWIDLFMTDAGVQSYYAGDAWPEIVETRAGEFSHLGLVDPTTVDPDWDRHGEFTSLDQVIVDGRGRPQREPLDMERVYHFTHSNATGGPLGESLVARNMDEIERFASNQVQRANAIKLHGSPKYDVSVGSEGQSIPDKIIRLIRNRFRPERVDEKTTWVHGGQIDIATLDSPGFEGMGDITETDARMLAWAFDFPLEWTNFGSAGLGEGTPAKSRLVAFERDARAEQQRRIVQFMPVLRRVLEEYSPYPRDIDVTVRFGDVISDQQAIADWLSSFSWAFHRDEIRELLDQPPWDEDDEREAPPERAPDVSRGGGGGLFDEGGGGLFARPDRDEAPDPLAGDDAAKRAHADGGTAAADGSRALLHDSRSDAELTREELVFEDIIERVLWSDDTSRQLFAFDDEDVPEFVKERLESVIPRAVSEATIETLNPSQRGRLQQVLKDSLETRHGWSIDSIADNIMEMDGADLTREEAERLGRDLTQSAVSKAREEGWEEQFGPELDEERFYWVGPDDDRNTPACEWLKEQTNPREGGTPVPMDELKELIQEANARFIEHDAREWSPHIQCRHQPVRAA